MRIKLLAAAIAAASISCGAAQASTNLLVNGGFERPQGPGEFRIDPPAGNVDIIPGWTVFGNSSVAWLGAGYGAAPYEGSMYVELMGYTDTEGRYGGVSQTIATTAGSRYRLSFVIGQLGSQSPLPGVLATAGSTSASRVGSSLPWTGASLDFTATGASTLISIEGNQGTFHIGVDDVRVEELASGTPEPATWAAMIAGFGLSGAALRRRRAATA